MLNYWKTSTAEVYALQPMAPWVTAEGQTTNNAKAWSEANRKNFTVLEYKPITVAGVLAPPPQRMPPPTPSPAMAQEVAMAGEGIKASLGMFDAANTQTRQDISGKAIISRQMQGETSTYQ